MQFKPRVTRHERRPLGLGLLHAIFAKDALTRRDHRLARALAQALLVVRRRDRREGGELLIPFVAEYVIRVDAGNRLLEMRLPEGLLEINAPMTEEEKREAGERG